ncbi:hypothetical protein ACV30S_13460 [Clostridium perfringens]
MAEAKVTSVIDKSLTLNGDVIINKDGVKQTVLTMSCALKENEVVNIATYVVNQELFLENSKDIVVEVEKFKAQVKEESSKMNCFVF